MIRSMVIFDLDGTLSDDRDRWARHVGDLDPSKFDQMDWDAYHSTMLNDAPVVEVMQVMESFKRLGYGIMFSTGRPEQYREPTVEWLQRHGTDPMGYPNLLRMRPHSALDSNVEVKRQALKAVRREHPVLMAFENDERTIAMYREEGVTCLKVSL